MKHYDTIICGAGLSGRILAYYLCKANPEQKILLIDKNFNSPYDALIGYWEDDAKPIMHDFPITKYSYKDFQVLDENNVYDHHLDKYSYKYFYKFELFKFIDAQIQTKCEYLTATVTNCFEEKQRAVVELDDGTKMSAKKLYSSIELKNQKTNSWGIIENKQFFSGLEIQTSNAHQFIHPIFMDFRFKHQNQFGFAYLLPLAADRIFVHLVDYKQYPTLELIQQYLAQHYNIKEYKTIRKEKGCTKLRFGRRPQNSSKIKYIGGAGEMINPVTGYGLVNFVQYAQTEVGKRKLVNEATLLSWWRNLLFVGMMLFIKYIPNFARTLFARINKIQNYELVLDFVDRKGGVHELWQFAKSVF